MVGRDLGGDRLAALASTTHELQRAARGQVADVERSARIRGELQVALDGDDLARRRDARQARGFAARAGVHHTRAGDGEILAVLPERHAFARGPAERIPCETLVGKPRAVVAERADARGGHGFEIDELLPA